MTFLLLKSIQSKFRFISNHREICYVCFHNLSQKTFLVQQWRLIYPKITGSLPKTFSLKSGYPCCLRRNIPSNSCRTSSIACSFIRRMSTIIDNAVAEEEMATASSTNNVDSDILKSKNDADVLEKASENDTNGDNPVETKSPTSPTDDSSPENVSNVNKVCEQKGTETTNHAKNVEITAKKNYVPAPGAMSKRALKKWKRQQSKGIKSTGPLTTNPDPGYGSDVLSETEYYYEDGLRKVYPYYHEFSSYVKGRWVRRTVFDVFKKEFHVPSDESLLNDLKTGSLRVNNKIVAPDYKLRFNDFMSHKIHRHENPVVGTKLEIIKDDEHVVVINKPSSIPCHPCGRYRYNSIVFILGKEYGYSNLRNIYRLDRLTSGVLICAKTSEKTRELEDQILNKLVRKEYVCRVFGKFPDEEIEVDQPLECINHKISLWQIRESGKPSKTLFKRLSYNGTSSVVQCIPFTGRTHQIRVHLQYLGHPILNDPLYFNEAWGPESAKGKIFKCKIDDKKIGDAVMKNHNIGLWVKGPNPRFQSRLQQVKEEEAAREAASASTNSVSGSHEGETNSAKDEDEDEAGDVKEPPSKRFKANDADTEKESRPGYDPQKWIPDENCIHCQTEYIDPRPKDLIMYLHALSYKGPDWEYRTSLPDWAQPDWQEKYFLLSVSH